MSSRVPLSLLHIGGPTIVLRIGALAIISDPTFDEARDYESPRGVRTKLTGPAVAAAELGRLDVALVSHDEHIDNLDLSGRALLEDVPVVLTTPSGAGRLAERVPGVRGLAPWEEVVLDRPDGGRVVVTGLPARHGPVGSEPVVGDVTGFLLHGDDVPTTYVSGDNAGLDIVEQVAERFPDIDIAIIHGGAVHIPAIDGQLTLSSAEIAAAARILGARLVVPIHTEGWGHFTEGPDLVEKAFAEAGLEHLLTMPDTGREQTLLSPTTT